MAISIKAETLGLSKLSQVQQKAMNSYFGSNLIETSSNNCRLSPTF